MRAQHVIVVRKLIVGSRGKQLGHGRADVRPSGGKKICNPEAGCSRGARRLQQQLLEVRLPFVTGQHTADEIHERRFARISGSVVTAGDSAIATDLLDMRIAESGEHVLVTGRDELRERHRGPRFIWSPR